MQGAAISAAIHYKWGYIHPVLMQSILIPLSLKDSKILGLYVLGLAMPPRPWIVKQSNPLEALMPAAAPAVDTEKDSDGKSSKKKSKKTKKAD
jgi:hypothetical protein